MSEDSYIDKYYTCNYSTGGRALQTGARFDISVGDLFKVIKEPDKNSNYVCEYLGPSNPEAIGLNFEACVSWLSDSCTLSDTQDKFNGLECHCLSLDLSGAGHSFDCQWMLAGGCKGEIKRSQNEQRYAIDLLEANQGSVG